jgi:hypothetical protein
MAALTSERDTVQSGDGCFPTGNQSYKVKAATKCLQGGIAVSDAGYAAPGRTATGLVAIGVFSETADNTSGAAGAIEVDVLEGVFKFANHGADLVAQANVGSDCYIVDDQTVAATSGGSTRSRAGKVVRVESDGVLVRIGLGV